MKTLESANLFGKSVRNMLLLCKTVILVCEFWKSWHFGGWGCEGDYQIFSLSTNQVVLKFRMMIFLLLCNTSECLKYPEHANMLFTLFGY